MFWKRWKSCNNALDILIGSFSGEWEEIIDCLRRFQISTEEIIISGGNESMMPKKIDDMLFPQGWAEMRIVKFASVCVDDIICAF